VCVCVFMCLFVCLFVCYVYVCLRFVHVCFEFVFMFVLFLFMFVFLTSTSSLGSLKSNWPGSSVLSLLTERQIFSPFLTTNSSDYMCMCVCVCVFMFVGLCLLGYVYVCLFFLLQQHRFEQWKMQVIRLTFFSFLFWNKNFFLVPTMFVCLFLCLFVFVCHFVCVCLVVYLLMFGCAFVCLCLFSFMFVYVCLCFFLTSILIPPTSKPS